jgi:hypothetical protein
MIYGATTADIAEVRLDLELGGYAIAATHPVPGGAFRAFAIPLDPAGNGVLVGLSLNGKERYRRRF